MGRFGEQTREHCGKEQRVLGRVGRKKELSVLNWAGQGLGNWGRFMNRPGPIQM